jgi:hypothetical protein
VAEHFPRPTAGKTASHQTRPSKKNIECEKNALLWMEAEGITWELLCHYGTKI